MNIIYLPFWCDYEIKSSLVGVTALLIKSFFYKHSQKVKLFNLSIPTRKWQFVKKKYFDSEQTKLTQKCKHNFIQPKENLEI